MVPRNLSYRWRLIQSRRGRVHPHHHFGIIARRDRKAVTADTGLCTLLCYIEEPAMNSSIQDKVARALSQFRIELPSWGFANTGTRFGKFIQLAAATTTEEKFSDAGQVHLLTGACPTIALHVLWDFPDGARSVDEIQKFSERNGVQPGSINPNLFQDQQYKYGSFGNPDPAIRKQALQHVQDSIGIARHLRSRDISLWFADGSNYPGTANIRH